MYVVRKQWAKKGARRKENRLFASGQRVFCPARIFRGEHKANTHAFAIFSRGKYPHGVTSHKVSSIQTECLIQLT